MRFTGSLVLLTGLAVVSQGSPQQPQPAKPAVPVVKDAIVLFNFGPRPKVVYEAPAPVTSLEEGLPYAQKASKLPILAMSESAERFFYATSVGRDGYGRPRGVLISGYAIKRGARQVVFAWSGW
jgi:hypothetical protein